MAMFLGESTVLPVPPFQQSQSITKKISNYIFRFEDKIGQGNFSKVYKGFHQLTNQQVAIKIIELSSVKSGKLQELLFSEIEVIQSLNHPNILKCYQVLKSENNCYIITELCNGGDLQSVLRKQKCLNEISSAPYIRDIFKGLLYLGERGIVHRDLKIANIFLHNGVCKIADFGFAKYTNNQNFFDLDIGSPLYMSPEGMIQHMYGMKTDIWAFGIILFELLHGKTPFSYCITEYELKRAVVTPISYHSIRPDLSPQVRQLILKCLVVDSTHRQDAVSLKNDQFLCSLLNGMNNGVKYVNKIQQNIMQQPQNIMPAQIQHNNVPDHFQKVETVSSSNNQIVNQNFYLQPVQNYNNNNQLVPPKQYNPQLNHPPSAKHLQSPSLPQIHVPLQFNTNSPARIVGSIKNGTKQPSMKDSKIKQQLNVNQNLSTNYIQQSPNNKYYPHSYQNIHVNSYIDLIPHTNYPKNGPDRILVPEDSTEKTKDKQLVNDNFDKVSNSSWSHDNVGKKKFPKNLSYQNINKVQNNLAVVNLQNKIKDNQNTSMNTNPKGKVQSSYQAISTSQNPQRTHNSTSNGHGDKNISQSFTNKPSSNNILKLNFKQDANKSSKKFGEIIKGQKRTDVNIKSVIKLDKVINSDQKSMIERSKTKSQIKYDQVSIANTSESPNRERMARHSIGDVSSYNQSQYMNQSLQPTNRSVFPTFIQEKQRQKQQLKRNLICTIMEFKQAVGFLHYCRLYYRFIVMLKKVMLYPEVKKYDFLANCFNNFNEHVEIYWRYLLTALSELIENIRCKEIIYDGDNYKKKKMKEDKLKQVTEQYFKKYMQQTNRNRTSHHKIVPTHVKSTSISFMKDHNEQLWEQLDSEYTKVIEQSRKTTQVGETFIKNFRNLCYFAIRINQANEIITNCVHLKNYKLLGDAMIENWLAQEYYGQEVYFRLKNDHFRRINSTNALKNSQTNDTETENHSRTKYM